MADSKQINPTASASPQKQQEQRKQLTNRPHLHSHTPQLQHSHQHQSHSQSHSQSSPGAGIATGSDRTRTTSTRTRTQSSSSQGSDKCNYNNYTAKRRPPPKSDIKINEVYIGEKSKFKSQLEKCKKLLDGGQKDVYLHGLGTSIPRALNIALELKNFYQGTLDFSSTTSTVKLIDDLVPEDDSTLPSYSVRNVSSVKVHLFRTVKIP